MPDPKSEFENTTGGYVGVLVKDHSGRMKGIPVPPHATIWLDEDEQIATANAPRRDEDNPFTNGQLALRTPATQIANRRPIGHTEHPQVQGVGDGGESAEESAAAEEEGGAANDGGDKEAPQGDSAEPDQAEPEGEGEEPKPPEEMDKEEKQAHNAKEAAKRAIPTGGGPQGRPQSDEETGAVTSPSGKAPEGKRTATEQVGTPEAAGK